MEHRVFALPAGSTVIRLLPPLVITDEQLDTVADRLIEVLTDDQYLAGQGAHVRAADAAWGDGARRGVRGRAPSRY